MPFFRGSPRFRFAAPFVVALASALAPSPARAFLFAQAQEAGPTAVSTADKAQQLDTIQRDIAWLQKTLDQRRKELANAGKDRAADIEDDIADLETRLQKAKNSFIATASEVELPGPESRDNKPKKRDLLQEAQQFIEPIFDAIRRVSEKPRRIEGYRTAIFNLHERLSQIDAALANLDRVIKDKTFPAFSSQLEDSRQELAHNRDELQIQINGYERKLNQELSDRRTVMQVVSQDIQDFLSTKGRNLLIAIAVFAGVFWGLLYLRRFVFRLRSIRSHGQLEKFLRSLYGILAGAVGLFAVLMTLRLLNDWFLVTLITLMLLSLAWAFKAFMPVIVNELKFVLNVGPVKQGERLVWQGVPWLVKTVGFRSTLDNEALQGGRITVAASALTGLLSRVVVPGEPWFPTSVGDFVLLDDGNFGQVEIQTPENVILNIGNSRKFYPTSAFLAKNPQNFSQGFEVTADVFIRHPDRARPRPLEELNTVLADAVKTRMKPRLADLKSVTVTAAAPSPQSTRICASAACAGRLASARDDLKRELQSALAEAWRAL